MKNTSVKRYSALLFLQIVVVLAVILIFRLVPDRATGGLVAGAVFSISTLVVLIAEWRAARKMTWALAGALVFFVGGILPILILRGISWGGSFDAADVLGISGAVLHRSSNVFFLVYLVGIFISLHKARRESRRINY